MVREAVEITSGERIAELERTITSLREDSEVAHALLGLSGALAEVRSLEQTLDQACAMVRDLLGAERCFSATWIAGQQRFEINSHVGYDEDAIALLHTLSDEPDGLPLLRRALSDRTPLLIGDTVAAGLFTPEEAEMRRCAAYIGLPLIRWGEEFGSLGLTYPEPRQFTSKEEALARGIARTVGVALANARQFNLLQTLRQFGEKVGSKLSLQRVIDEVASGARSLLHGDGAWIYFLDASNRELVVTGHEPLPIEILARLDITNELWAPLAAGRAIPITNLEEIAPSSSGPISAVIAPIPGTESALLGAVLVLFERSLLLGADDVEALSVLAGQSSMAIENAQRFERQQRVARSLQQGLLSTEMPELKDCSFGAVYEPAGGDAEIGGDFFDVFDLPDGRVAIAVGDVSGKGAEAAAQTAMAKYMLRAFATRNPAPTSALFHLNNALVKSFDDDKFITLMYGVFDPESYEMTIGRAGHPPPLIYRFGTGTVDAIEVPGSMLGCFPDETFDQQLVHLDAGDVFVAYTDGIVEARESDRLYGRWRLEKALAHYASSYWVDDLARRLYQDAESFGRIADDTIVFTLGCRVAPK
ncbi:MAG TPA: SpoIIE family protein phosphatase [Actinomycetota bacterium]|nr:SpoIIE family protein phosphatase [Actinomycetota bacterium]